MSVSKNKVPGVRFDVRRKHWVVEHNSIYVCRNRDWFEAVCARKSKENLHRKLTILSIAKIVL